MLKYHTIDVSCRVIPQEVSLIFNITGCTIKCPGCCERALWKDKGIPLTFDELRSILENYNAKVDDHIILARESWWKETLQSRTWGYNSN